MSIEYIVFSFSVVCSLALTHAGGQPVDEWRLHRSSKIISCCQMVEYCCHCSWNGHVWSLYILVGPELCWCIFIQFLTSWTIISNKKACAMCNIDILVYMLAILRQKENTALKYVSYQLHELQCITNESQKGLIATATLSLLVYYIKLRAESLHQELYLSLLIFLIRLQFYVSRQKVM